MASSGPRFFASPATFDAWLARNGDKRAELVVGFWKVGTGKPSMTWAQSVEVALRHGWIDGVRHSLDDESYTIRFTPRKPGSHWSLVNVRTAKRLVAEARMTPAGLAAFKRRRSERTGHGAYAQRTPVPMPAEYLRRLKADRRAWAWFQAAAPSYQRACAWWIHSAKRPETKERRFAQVVAHARQGRVAPQYEWRKGKATGRGRA
jgi:uncharacterized protein YdeI (YjbR/CyaY-like superfamily)